jgi:hypothetical protein
MANGVIIRKGSPEGTNRAGPISNTLSSGSQNKDRQASSNMLNNPTLNNPTPSNSMPSNNSSLCKSRSGRSNSSGKTTITSRNAPSSSDNSNMLSNSNSGRMHNSKTVLGNNSTINKPIAHQNSDVSSRVGGRSIAHETGSRTIALGSNAGAIADTASLTTGIGVILGRATASESRGFPFWLSEDIHAFSTRAIG